MAFNADRAPGDRATSDQSWGVDSDIFRKPTVSPLALASLCRGGAFPPTAPHTASRSLSMD